jgi:hypothetical protein
MTKFAWPGLSPLDRAVRIRRLAAEKRRYCRGLTFRRQWGCRHPRCEALRPAILRSPKGRAFMKRTLAAFCAAVAMSSVAVAAQKPKTVTLTGCVRSAAERNVFVLTKVDGADAPRARGWKTGYLLKRPSNLEVVPGVSSIRLRDHVGRRVTVTGTLEQKDRAQIRARTIRIVSSCA